MRVVILSAGFIDYTHLPVGTSTSNAMIPVNGKPVIAWILEDLVQKGITEVTLVLRAEDTLLSHFVRNLYLSSLTVQLVEIVSPGSILDSLLQGLSSVATGTVGVLLGDTLIRDDFRRPVDFVYTHEVRDSHRWCLVQTDPSGIITHYLDKEHGIPPPCHALCGYYFFSDPELLRASVDKALTSGKRQLSDMLTEYQKVRPLKSITAQQWFDFGNIDNLIRSKQRLLQSRYFNSLTIDPLLNAITKVSDFDEKLRNELNWYESVPDVIKVLSPRIISKHEIDGKLHLVQEYYGYPTLAELFIYSDIDPEIWSSIFEKLLDIHGVLRSYKVGLERDDLHTIYYTKTFERLTNVEDDPVLGPLLRRTEITVNGELLLGMPQLWNSLEQAIEQLSDSRDGSIIHGDYCFSNILFDYGNQIIRLIDPRGSFGKVGIYGDPRYDIAKLRHSIAGRYDLIVADLFTLSGDDQDIKVAFYPVGNYEELRNQFDRLVESHGYSINEIMLIEGLLFLSMLPLHRDKPVRQQVMFLRGLELLNKVLKTQHAAHRN